MKRTEFRRCPCCGERGIDTKEVYPHGTACKFCLKLIEVNLTAITLVIGTLLCIMFIDLRFYDTGIGLFAAMLLIYIGAFYQKAYGAFMPLKHYED